MSHSRLMKFNIQPVPSLPGAFISDEGSAYGRDRHNPRIYNLRKPYVGKVGYYVTMFADTAKKKMPRYYHRMVAEAFLPPQPENCEVRHLDGNRLNNLVANLCWGTRLENVQDTIRHGRHGRGEDAGASKLTSEDVQVIRFLLRRGSSCYSIANVFEVSGGTIAAIRDRKTWSCLQDVENPQYN